MACRANPSSPNFVHFYDDDPGMRFTRWARVLAEAAWLGRAGIQFNYGREARHTYAVGTSNRGYQVRRAVESYPELFDGGVDWEGTFVEPETPNLLSTLPPAGYPPDLVIRQAGRRTPCGVFITPGTWEITMCQWQKRLDPDYNTYDAGLGNYIYVNRLSVSRVGDNLAEFRTTGRILRPLITVAGTMDALLPIDDNARAYARRVAAAARTDKDAPAYRLYEVQNGNHLDLLAPMFPALEIIEPHAQQAFDMVSAVEHYAELPPSQCIPRGGAA
jgi:3HB-oligomer hydrolase (3HBOH)